MSQPHAVDFEILYPHNCWRILPFGCVLGYEQRGPFCMSALQRMRYWGGRSCSWCGAKRAFARGQLVIVGQLRDICGATGAAPPASGSHVAVADTCRVMHGTWGMFGRGAMLPATMFDLSMWRKLVRRGHCFAVVLLSPVLQLCRGLGFCHNGSGYVSLRRSGIVRNSSLQC